MEVAILSNNPHQDLPLLEIPVFFLFYVMAFQHFLLQYFHFFVIWKLVKTKVEILTHELEIDLAIKDMLTLKVKVNKVVME